MAVNGYLVEHVGGTNKKSIFGGFCRRTLFILLIVAGIQAGTGDPTNCAAIKNVFVNKGLLTAEDLRERPDSDADGLCLNQGCCGPQARPKLTAQAKAQLERSLRTEITKLADILASRAVKFDEFFRRLLHDSREEFHAMFKRTYGMIYEQHSYVFEQLFEKLERYYLRGDVDLIATINHFFGILYEKMFTVLNSQYSFDDKYLQCVNEHMRETQPFDDVPNKLSVQLRRAFVATRTFHKALRQGSDIVRAMVKLGIGEECSRAWARLQWCGTCGGLTSVPSCTRYCHNVLRGCLPRHADLATDWDAYVDAVDKVADRLLGPFNIVMVVEPIDIKISEAIMNFQEHNHEISQKIFSGCGKPILGERGGTGPFLAPDRTKRSIDYSKNDDFEIETSFESVLNEDPALLNIESDELRQLTNKMDKSDRYSRYIYDDTEDYDSHERRRRDADAAPEPASSEIDFKPYEFDGKKKNNNKKVSASESGESMGEWGGAQLERVVREARARVRNSRRYWEQLPYLLCSDVAAQPSAPCFNGTHRASYTLSAAGAGSAALASNPEVSREPPELANSAAHLSGLKQLTARLKDAFNGVDVQWRDNDDLRTVPPLDLLERAGSGSGSGEEDDLPDDDEDRVPSRYFPGSGDGPPDQENGESDIEQSTESREDVPEVPFTPIVVSGGGDTRNVRIGDNPSEPNIDDVEPRINVPVEPQVPVRDVQPVTDAASRPSLNVALFTYAMPVVCAWFGTMVTDLF